MIGVLCVEHPVTSSIFKVIGFMFLNCGEARFDGNSELVAELVTVNGFKGAYAIKDGAEGPRGWKVTTTATISVVEILLLL